MLLSKLLARTVCGILALLTLAAPILAANGDVSSGDELQAVVSTRGEIPVKTELSFSAARSHNPFAELPVAFSWNFGDGFLGAGEEVKHTFTRPGVYEASLMMQVGTESDSVGFPIFVYERSILFVSDNATHDQQLAVLAEVAREKNIFLDPAWGFGESEGFFAEEGAISAALQEKLETLRETDLIVLWTAGSDGLNGLARLAQNLNPPLDFSAKKIATLTDGNIEAITRIARGVFATIRPAEILISRSESLRDIVLADANEDLPALLERQAIPHRVIDSGLEKFSITAPLAFFVNYLVANGIPASAILLVLLLPVIATLVAFFKQVIGITTFGVYTPSVLTLSFLAVGLKLGLVVLFVVVLASILIRKILKRYRLAYTPRLAIVLTFVSLAILAAIVLLTWLAPFGEYYRISDLIAASIFPMLIMSTLAEKFVSIQTEKGSGSAIHMFTELIFVSVACYFIVGEWSYLQTLILSRPEVIFLFLIANIILGRFTGLRLTEYIRFRDVIKKAEEE